MFAKKSSSTRELCNSSAITNLKNTEKTQQRIKKKMSGIERLQRMFAGAGGALGHPPPDSPTLDSSEQVYISSLALLKMLKHGKSRVF